MVEIYGKHYYIDLDAVTDRCRIESIKKHEEEDEEENDDDDDYGKIMQQIATTLPSIVVLLGLFSEKQDNLLDSLEKSRNDIDALQELCSCKTIDEANILDCFLNSPVHNFSKDKLIKIVDLLILLLNISIISNFIKMINI